MKNPEKFEEDELEFWHDYKINKNDVVFPIHKENMNGECITRKIDELNK